MTEATKTTTLVDVIEATTGVAKQKMAEAAGKATVDASQRQNYEGDGTDLIETDGGKLVVEAYPIYAPVPGITLRIDSQQAGIAARWIDITMDEAYAIMSDLESMIAEVEAIDAPSSMTEPDPADDEWRKPTGGTEKPKPEFWCWQLGDPEVVEFPEGKEGKTAVVMSNHPETGMAWFTSPDEAKAIIGRLNDRLS